MSAKRDRAAEAYAIKEYEDFQEHLRLGGKGVHVRSFIKLGFCAGYDQGAADARAEARELAEALEFYRNEVNWLKGFGEACSPVIADTGARAKKALARYREGEGKS